MRLTKPLLSLGLLLLLLAGCSTSKPLLNPDIQLPTTQEFSQVELQQALISALERRKWQVEQVTPAQIRASISVRQRHHASIAIDYDPFAIRIRHLASQGLGYKDGRIHRNYNRWIANLRNEILRQLSVTQPLP